MPKWFSSAKDKLVAFATGLGAPGLFLISFLDSSFLTFPVINDLLLVQLSIRHPGRMVLYALMASAGSVGGCIVLYLIARKGEEAVFHRQAGKHGHAIRHWVEQNGFTGMLFAALLPPPVPFKIFVLAAGVFEVPFASFSLAVIIARLARYFAIGFLSVRYGKEALPFLAGHKFVVATGIAVVAGLSYLASRFVLKHRHPPAPPAKSFRGEADN